MDRKIYDKKTIFVSSHPLTNFEIQRYYQNEPRDLTEFVLQIICLKNKGWGKCTKSWWICRCI